VADGFTARWQKSTRSMGAAQCVEVARLPGGDVAVRDSKDQNGPVLVYTPAEWHAFLDGAKKGEFDDLAR
jgi:hypothetical protein